MNPWKKDMKCGASLWSARGLTPLFLSCVRTPCVERMPQARRTLVATRLNIVRLTTLVLPKVKAGSSPRTPKPRGTHTRLWQSWFIALLTLFAPTAFAQFTVSNVKVVSEKRMDRTRFEYLMRADLTNSGAPAEGVIARATSTAATTTISEDALSFGDLATAAIAPGTMTLQVTTDAARLARARWNVGADARQSTTPETPACPPPAVANFLL